MNSIEAMQRAKDGDLITCDLMLKNRFLRYIPDGYFYEYEIVNQEEIFKYEIHNLPIGYILSQNWSVYSNALEELKIEITKLLTIMHPEAAELKADEIIKLIKMKSC